MVGEASGHSLVTACMETKTEGSYLKQQSKHFISMKHVVLVSQWNDEKTFKKNPKKSLIPR